MTHLINARDMVLGGPDTNCSPMMADALTNRPRGGFSR
jgi:hypothetical protein